MTQLSSKARKRRSRVRSNAPTLVQELAGPSRDGWWGGVIILLAAALLRLVIQRLLKYLGAGGKDLNEDIASLVSKGLDRRIQMSLDVVRVIGNNAVHPGQIELKDDRPTANTLFSLVNLIVDSMISQPKHIEATYKSLPATAHDQIEKRDKKK